MKNISFIFLFLLSFTTYAQPEPEFFAKLLAETQDPKSLDCPLPESILMLPPLRNPPVDTEYNWQLCGYQKRGWSQIVGSQRSEYKKTYRGIKPEMTFSGALLSKTFRLSEKDSRWHIRQQPSSAGGIYLIISSYNGNPYANMTSWEEEELYIFTQHGLRGNTAFLLDNLLEETADPDPFFAAGPDPSQFVVFKSYTISDTSSWQLIGYEERAWQDILGRDAHTTGYRKYIAKADAILSGKELRKEFGMIGSGPPPPAYPFMSGWRSSMNGETMMIQASNYRQGDMTNWGHASSYYFKKAK